MKIRPGIFRLLWIFAALVLWQPALAQLPKTVRIASVAYFDGDQPEFTGVPAVMAEQGWLAGELKKRGVALEWVPAPHTSVGPVINEAFANHRVDFASYGDLPSIIINAGGVQTRAIVGNGRGSDTFLVVPVGSSAKNIADLKGKRIAIHRGRPWELPFIHLLEANGLKYSDFKIYNMNPQAGAAAIAAGSIDALYTLNDAYLLEDKKVGKIIWSTKGAPADWKMRTELWADKAFIDAYPELTQLVATAYVKALHWTAQEQNRSAFIKLTTRSGTPESVSWREYDDPAALWSARWSPLFDDYALSHYRHAVDFALDKKLIRKPLKAQELIDSRFVSGALQNLGLNDYWQPRAVAATTIGKQP